MSPAAAALLALLGAPAAAGAYPERLSEWGLFEGPPAEQRPARGVQPYGVNAPLFSDYAEKHRFARLPEGRKARWRADRPFGFPVGTVLVKTFAYPRDRRDASLGERLVETRLLVREREGWVGLPYLWDEEQGEARLVPAGAAVDGVSWIHDDGEERSLRYLVPNMNQCKACHEAEGRGSLGPLGVSARNLNGELRGRGARPGNQLQRWVALGLLDRAPRPEKAPRLARWQDPAEPLEARARSWLEANCAHCHNPRGPASGAGLDLRAVQKRPLKYGVHKAPVAAGPGTGGRPFDIVPGKPEESILLFRIESVEPGVMMPELGRRLVDEEGAELVRRWIAGLAP